MNIHEATGVGEVEEKEEDEKEKGVEK